MYRNAGRIGAGLFATMALLAVSALSGAAAHAKDQPVDQSLDFLANICLPAAQQGHPSTYVAVPDGYRSIRESAAAGFLGGEKGAVYASENTRDPVLALWDDGRCAVYLRRVEQPAAISDQLAAWATSLGLSPVPELEKIVSETGTQAVTRRFTSAAGLMILVTHHQREGTRTGGATVSVLPPGS